MLTPLQRSIQLTWCIVVIGVTLVQEEWCGGIVFRDDAHCLCGEEVRAVCALVFKGIDCTIPPTPRLALSMKVQSRLGDIYMGEVVLTAKVKAVEGIKASKRRRKVPQVKSKVPLKSECM